MIEKKFLVNIGGDRIEVGAPDFYERTETLAVSYKECRDQSVRGDILIKLLDLLKPVLKAWKISEESDREDYEQDCYFLLDMALAAFKPAKGNFVVYLKNYISGYRRKAQRGGKTETEKLLTVSHDFNSGSEDDFLPTVTEEEDLGTDLERTERLIGKDRFALIKMRLIDGMTKQEVADATGLSLRTVHTRLVRAYNAMRAGIILKAGIDSSGAFDEEGGTYVKAKQLCHFMNVSYDKLYRWSRDGYATRYRIDPNHIVQFGGNLRYRVKFEHGKLVSPRVILRKGFAQIAKPIYFSRAARLERKRLEEESRRSSQPE